MAVKEFVGTVVSDKAINTRVVAVNDRIQHKNYKKVIILENSPIIYKI